MDERNGRRMIQWKISTYAVSSDGNVRFRIMQIVSIYSIYFIHAHVHINKD